MLRSPTPLRRPSPQAPSEDRRRLLLAGFGILGSLSVLLVLLWLGRWLPGWPGEVFRMITGLLTTPVFMEISFFLLGLFILLAINAWRRHRDGDDCVWLEQVIDHPELPPHARFAVHRNPPLPGIEPDPLLRAEGALEIGDHESAADAIAELDPATLESPAAIAIRIRLARATGRDDLAKSLEHRR